MSISWGTEQSASVSGYGLNTYYGWRTDFHKNTAIISNIGANLTNSNGNSFSGVGEVSVFNRSGAGQAWSLVASLRPDESDYVDSLRFGNSIGIHNKYVVVGNNKSACNYVYVFKGDSSNSYTKIAKLTPQTDVSGGYFGRHVSINGNYIIASDHEDYSIYVFKNDGSDGFSQIAKLTESSNSAPLGNHGVYFDGTTLGAIADTEAYFWRINSDDTFTYKTSVTLGSTPAAIVGKFIIDGDLFIAFNWAQGSYGKVWIYKSNSDGSSWTLKKHLLLIRVLIMTLHYIIII